MKHTLSILVENEFGVLTRVSGLFSGRGFNIQSLTVAETLDPTISRMTLTTSGSDSIVEQINKQLNKLVNVIKVQDVTKTNAINHMLALIKVGINSKNRFEVLKTIDLLGGETLDTESKYCIAQFRGDHDKIKTVLNQLKPYGIIEFNQTGSITMERGSKVMK